MAAETLVSRLQDFCILLQSNYLIWTVAPVPCVSSQYSGDWSPNVSRTEGADGSMAGGGGGGGVGWG